MQARSLRSARRNRSSKHSKLGQCAHPLGRSPAISWLFPRHARQARRPKRRGDVARKVDRVRIWAEFSEQGMASSTSAPRSRSPDPSRTNPLFLHRAGGDARSLQRLGRLMIFRAATQPARSSPPIRSRTSAHSASLVRLIATQRSSPLAGRRIGEPARILIAGTSRLGPGLDGSIASLICWTQISYIDASNGRRSRCGRDGDRGGRHRRHDKGTIRRHRPRNPNDRIPIGPAGQEGAAR